MDEGRDRVVSLYRGKRTLASADPINVTAPTLHGGIDDTLLRVSKPGVVYLPLIRQYDRASERDILALAGTETGSCMIIAFMLYYQGRAHGLGS